MKKIVCVIMAVAMMLCMASCSSAPAEGTYKVGICQLVQHDALDAATLGFKEALTEKLGDKVSFIEQNASGDAATCVTICNQLVAEGVDLMMGNATAALQAAAAASATIPVVGTSITDYATALEIADWTGKTGSNITGTADLAPLDQQAAMIQELFPDAETVGILYCSAEANSVYQSDVITGYLTDMGYAVEVFTFADSNDVANVTTAACAAADVLYIPTDNTAASCTETIANVAIPAGKAIVAGEAGICGGCGVATLSIDYYDIGYAAGEMAYEILVNGANPGDMEIQYAPEVQKLYNEANCNALGITIPEGYAPLA
ncbi:MAG: ABC transporter substrate-binding protein [Oscillospiraceae bacterium]|nr:ABC transporter substrate-binding protein [Oscillospiraceae bacterium]MBQ3237347.1 ABC transporter substrate-binding protein [Oscillospiraceae bacterium]MBQ3561805.1 ABC transporter substrate-binding protein [Oscillospiraceae bacterium]MBQ6699125.1 ABC transporter substrate-binding protein [Oscillospiraceae bacterium]MBQ6801792.1 ABC transporter substrate-binding protein [Oscillospiraceae bacterium]